MSNKKEIEDMIEVLKENNFKELNYNENPEDFEHYLTAAEIAKKIDIRLTSEIINEALLSLGYKTFHNKIGLPANPDNSAFCMKMFEDEETLEKKYYIQCLWHESEVKNINEQIMSNEQFNEKKNDLINDNNKKINSILRAFKSIDDYITVSVKKTGFNPKQDFVIFISYSIYEKSNGLVNSGYIFIDDDLDDIKIDRYLKKNEISDMSPYDFIKIDLPLMDSYSNNLNFIDRKNSLRFLYKIFKDRNVIFYDQNEEVFIREMFKKENIPDYHNHRSSAKKILFFKDYIDWIEPKESMKLKKVYKRHDISIVSNSGFAREALMLNHLVDKLTNKI